MRRMSETAVDSGVTSSWERFVSGPKVRKR